MWNTGADNNYFLFIWCFAHLGAWTNCSHTLSLLCPGHVIYRNADRGRGIKVLPPSFCFPLSSVLLSTQETDIPTPKSVSLLCQFWSACPLLGGFHSSFFVQVSSCLIILLISKSLSHPSLWDHHLICSSKQSQFVHWFPHSFTQCFVCAALWILCLSWWMGGLVPLCQHLPVVGTSITACGAPWL